MLLDYLFANYIISLQYCSYLLLSHLLIMREYRYIADVVCTKLVRTNKQV